jgi:hypothetical protein
MTISDDQQLHVRRAAIAAAAWEWIENCVHLHLHAGGSLHSKGSGGLPATFRQRFLGRLDTGCVRYATPAALERPVAERVVEHVIPLKRIAIEIFDPALADPRSNTLFDPLAGGPARSPEDVLRIFDTLCAKCWVTKEEHARLNRAAASLQWDAPNGDGWARYRAAGLEVVEVPFSCQAKVPPMTQT